RPHHPIKADMPRPSPPAAPQPGHLITRLPGGRWPGPVTEEPGRRPAGFRGSPPGLAGPGPVTEEPGRRPAGGSNRGVWGLAPGKRSAPGQQGLLGGPGDLPSLLDRGARRAWRLVDSGSRMRTAMTSSEIVAPPAHPESLAGPARAAAPRKPPGGSARMRERVARMSTYQSDTAQVDGNAADTARLAAELAAERH